MKSVHLFSLSSSKLTSTEVKGGTSNEFKASKMSNSNGKKIRTNDGFGPQLTGKETVAELFKSKTLIRPTAQDLKERVVRERMSAELLRKLEEFSAKVSRKTPQYKFQILTDWLEHEVLEMILKRQVQSKTYYSILKSDVQLEEKKGVRGSVASASQIAKSSLLGRDPFGDERNLPEECYDTTYDKDDLTEVEVILTRTPREPTGTEESAGAESKDAEAATEAVPSAQKDPGEGQEETRRGRIVRPPRDEATATRRYNKEGMLVKRIQEQARDAIKVAIFYLLDDDLGTVIRKREQQYRRSAELRERSPRGCMPWKEVKDMVVARITEAAGWTELETLCKTRRADSQQPVSWVQTLNHGKEIVESFGHSITDSAYVAKALGDFMHVEVGEVEKYYLQTCRLDDPTMTMETAQSKLRSETWEEFSKMVDDSLTNSTRKYRKQNTTSSKSDKKKNKDKKDTGEDKQKTKKRKAREPVKVKNPCKKCINLGLTSQAESHEEKDCDPVKREAALRRKNNRAPRGRGDRGQSNPPRKKQPKVSCHYCEEAGRKKTNHKPENCLYQTVWKGLTGEALKQAQKEYYDKKKQEVTRTSRLASLVVDSLPQEDSEEAEYQVSDTDSEVYTHTCHMMKAQPESKCPEIISVTESTETDPDNVSIGVDLPNADGGETNVLESPEGSDERAAHSSGARSSQEATCDKDNSMEVRVPESIKSPELSPSDGSEILFGGFDISPPAKGATGWDASSDEGMDETPSMATLPSGDYPALSQRRVVVRHSIPIDEYETLRRFRESVEAVGPCDPINSNTQRESQEIPGEEYQHPSRELSEPVNLTPSKGGGTAKKGGLLPRPDRLGPNGEHLYAQYLKGPWGKYCLYLDRNNPPLMVDVARRLIKGHDIQDKTPKVFISRLNGQMLRGTDRIPVGENFIYVIDMEEQMQRLQRERPVYTGEVLSWKQFEANYEPYEAAAAASAAPSQHAAEQKPDPEPKESEAVNSENNMKCLVSKRQREKDETPTEPPAKHNKLMRKSTDKVAPKPLPSETKRYQLAQAYLDVRAAGSVRTVRAALDTQSNVSYVRERLSKPRQWMKGEVRTVKGIGGLAPEGEPRSVTIMRKGVAITLDARSPPMGLLDEGCGLLLSAQHCRQLGIDVNHTLQHLKHLPVRYLRDKGRKGGESSVPSWHWASDATLRKQCAMMGITNADRLSRSRMQRALAEQNENNKTCRMAEKKVSAFVKEKGLQFGESKQSSIRDIKFDECITSEQKAKLMRTIQSYPSVFSKSPSGLPTPMKGVPKHSFILKEGAKPIYCRRPYWGPQTREFLRKWTKWALKEGLIERAPRSPWASRIVLAPKYRGGTAKSQTPDDIRVCVDFTGVNQMIQKIVPTYPDPYEQMRRAAGFKYYFSGDGLKQFWSIVLHETSRDVTAVWTPLGLMRFTRLIMGTSNASTIAQNHYTDAMNKHLTGELPDGTPTRDRIFNFQDDFLIAANSIKELNALISEFLRMCHKAGIQMNPAKTHVCSGAQGKGVQFYGFNISEEGISPADKNLDPIRKMTAPKDVSGVRAILGVFNQFRQFIERYDVLTRPIQKLVRKNVPFVWNPEANRALEQMRAIMLKGDLYLKVQDPAVQLELETDSSDDGWGAILYQMIDGQRRVICMWSKQWPEAMRRMPAYYRETKAWMMGMEQARVYADYNQLPLLCWTDHMPLTYIKNTSGKGAVSQFHLDNLSSMDYVIKYRKGVEIGADHVSRFPLLGPQELSNTGKKRAAQALLTNLPSNYIPQGRLWVYAGKDSEDIRAVAEEWRTKRHQGKSKLLVSSTDKPTCKNVPTRDYGFAIWMPDADKIEGIIKSALNKQSPFACLIPACLVHCLTLSEVETARLQAAAKLSLLHPEMVWIVHGIKGMSHSVMAIWSIQSFATQLPQTSVNYHADGPRTWDEKDFVREQNEMASQYDPKTTMRRPEDEFLVYTNEEGRSQVIMPPKYAEKLVKWQHRQMCHAGYSKVYAAIKECFHWPSMKADTRKWIQACPHCQLLKAKRKRVHSHFRANPEHLPRTAYAMDFYSIPESKMGYKHILGIIDLATSELTLCPTKDRSAASVTECLLQRVFLEKGTPQRLHSDHAREFIAKAVKRICDLLGCRRTTTLAHHPTGNSTIERVWLYVALVLRIATKVQYQRWESLVKLWEHTWNTMKHEPLNVSPFEAAHGLPARSAAKSLAELPWENTSHMNKDDVAILTEAAKATTTAMEQLRRHDKSMRARHANNNRQRQTFKLGDKVSFFIPPSKETTDKEQRKAKHLMQYKGPAIITRVRTPTTYDLQYRGRKYSRATSELRPYKDKHVRWAPPITIDDPSGQINKGEFIAYLEQPGERNYHIGQVVQTGDDIVVNSFATSGSNIKNAQWKPLEQVVATSQYTLQTSTRRHQTQVQDTLPSQAIADLIIATKIKILPSRKISSNSLHTLRATGKTHHVLGRSFP